MMMQDSKNIIIADDSVFFRTKLSDILVEAGHKVIFARDGKEVIEKIRADNHTINLLILDIQMPEIDGFGVLKWLKENGYEGKFPVLAATGAYEATAVVDNLRELGAAGFMTKGATPEQIIFRVHSLLFPDIKSQRKTGERVPLSVPVDFTHEDNLIDMGFMQNISEGGMFLHANVKFHIGAKLRLRFSLPGIDRIFDLNGIVKWSIYKDPGLRDLFGGYGLMFTGITDDDRDAIKNFVKTEMGKLALE